LKVQGSRLKTCQLLFCPESGCEESEKYEMIIFLYNKIKNAPSALNNKEE
jgi:hypothetical protein